MRAGRADRWEGDVYRMGDVVQRWNGKQSAPLCRDCLPEKAVHANNKDEDGVTQLCAAAGTYSVDNPCRDCPEDAELDAMYEDEDGRAKQLCATHARAAGTVRGADAVPRLPGGREDPSELQGRGRQDRAAVRHACACGRNVRQEAMMNCDLSPGVVKLD